jgi:integrase
MSLAIKRYCDSARSSSEETYRVYKSRLSFFSDFAKKKYHESVDDLIEKLRDGNVSVYDMLSQYVLFLDKHGDANNTIRNKMTTTRKLLESCGVEVSPRKFKLKVRLPREVRSQNETIVKSDVCNILNSLENIRMKSYVMFLAATGCTAVEALSIRVQDIDFDATPARAGIQAKYTKTRVGRIVYLTDELRDQLKTWLEYKYRKRIRITYDRSPKKSKGKLTSRRYFTPKRNPNDLLFAYTTEIENINPRTMYINLAMTFAKYLDRNGFGARDSKGKRRKITLHSFRRFCKATISNAGYEDFSEYYLGHSGSTFWRTKESEKIKIFRKLEGYLTFLDVASLEAKRADQLAKIEQLQAQVAEITRINRLKPVMHYDKEGSKAFLLKKIEVLEEKLAALEHRKLTSAK